LNATFGNATELIVAIIALTQNQIRIVQTSLLGSILSNLLLVMGMSFFCGGLKYPIQRFNQTGAQTSSSLLTLAVMSILFPSTFFLAYTTNSSSVLGLSRVTAVVMLVVYISYLIFQLKTHTYLFEDVPALKEGKAEGVEEEQELPRLPPWGAVLLLAVATGLIAYISNLLVTSIPFLVMSANISTTFVGIVLLPIVGNAAEHITSVSVAMKNKMDLSIGVALGSGIQIALLVIPFSVVIGWIIGVNLDLNFMIYETAVLFLSVIIVNGVIADGESNYLEGILLFATYVIIAAGFFYSPD